MGDGGAGVTATSPASRAARSAPCWIGVDGGGTRSRAVVGDGAGRELGAADGGPGLIDPRDPDGAVQAMSALVRAAAADAGVELPARGLWAGLAGSGNEVARAAVEAGFRNGDLADVVVVGSDGEAAHAAAFGEGAGMLLVLGTGSVVRAVDRRGRVVTVGGWGALLGDEGSGYGIGLDGLRAVVRSEDGREPPTELGAALVSATGVAEVTELPAWAARAAKREIAVLAVEVARVARSGDTVAARVIHRALGEVRAHLEAVLEGTRGWEGSPPIALVGGLIREGGPLREAVVEMGTELGFDVRLDDVLPERGALTLAIGLSADRGGAT